MFLQGLSTGFLFSNLTQLQPAIIRVKKNLATKTTTFSKSPGYLRKNSNLRKKVLRLHSFGPFRTISTDNRWEISEFGRLSGFIEFFVLSDYAHFTFSDTI